MLNNQQKLQGTYIYKKDPALLRPYQTRRAIFSIVAFILYVIPPLFIDQEINALLNENKLFAIIQTYVIFTTLTGILLAYCLVCTFTRYRLRDRYPANKAPLDFNKRTWLCYELSFVCAILTSLCKLVGIFFAFSVWSLLLLFVSLSVIYLTFEVCHQARLAYGGDAMVLLSDEELKTFNANRDEFYDKYNEETEEFYD